MSNIKEKMSDFFNNPQTESWNQKIEENEHKAKSNKYMNQINHSKKFISLNSDYESTISTLSENAVFVFVALLSLLEKRNNCNTSISKLAARTGLCKRTVWEKLQELKNNNIVWYYSQENYDPNCDIPVGTYFINQNIVSYQNIKRLQNVPSTLPQSFRRSRGFEHWVQIDAHINSFNKLLTIGKENTCAFSFWFKSLFTMTETSIFRLTKKIVNSISVSFRTIISYINFLVKNKLISFNKAKKSFQVNAMLAWKRYVNKSVFSSDIAGIEENRKKNSDRYFYWKSYNERKQYEAELERKKQKEQNNISHYRNQNQVQDNLWKFLEIA